MLFYYNSGYKNQFRHPKDRFFYKSLGKGFLLGFLFLQLGGIIGTFVYGVYALNVNGLDFLDSGELPVTNASILIMSLFSQLALIAFCLLFAMNGKTNVKKAFAFNKCKPIVYLVSIFLTFLTLYTFCFSMFSFDVVLTNFGYQSSNSLNSISIDSVGLFIAYTLIVALLPAIGEELLFRGIILQSLLNRFGELPAALLSALAFMMMHSSPDQTVYQFFLGFVLAYTVIKSGSIIPAMIIHFVNNFYSIFLEYFKINAFWAPDSYLLLLFLAVLGIAIGIIATTLIIDAITGKLKENIFYRLFYDKILKKPLPEKQRELLPLDPEYIPMLPPEPTGNVELDNQYNQSYQSYLKYNKTAFNKAYNISTILFWVTIGICGAFWLISFVNGFI